MKRLEVAHLQAAAGLKSMKHSPRMNGQELSLIKATISGVPHTSIKIRRCSTAHAPGMNDQNLIMLQA
jgi:hypothetical protein